MELADSGVVISRPSSKSRLDSKDSQDGERPSSVSISGKEQSSATISDTREESGVNRSRCRLSIDSDPLSSHRLIDEELS